MTFKNEAEFKKFLLQKCKNALIKSQAQVYQIINRFVKEYYASFSPELYERTYQLYKSLVKSDIEPTANGFEAQVYFDLSELDYMTGARPSGEQVMSAAKQGFHGAMGTVENVELKYINTGGVGIWDDPKKILDAEAINILVRMLKSEGIPIKY